MSARRARVTVPSGSSAASSPVGTVYVASVLPAWMTTCLSPSSPGATKSRPPVPSSETTSRTVSGAEVSPVRLTVKPAPAPSVTAAPAVTVTAGFVAADGNASRHSSAAAKRRQPRWRAEAAVIGEIVRPSAVH